MTPDESVIKQQVHQPRPTTLPRAIAGFGGAQFVPVKGLSSGMVARLGFAIATDIQPEILILDEVLSVGDESFRHKCQRRIDQFWDSHVTILVVSHSMDFIQSSCDQAIWISKGNLKLAGDSKEVVKSYLESVT